MSELNEFVRLANQPRANRRELCRRFGISPQTAYKWLARYEAQGQEGLAKRSSRPLYSPKRSSGEVEEAVLALRETYPYWGGRKLRALMAEAGTVHVPSASTITEILRRHGKLPETPPETSPREVAPGRFEHPAPNLLWQMDFKGHFALLDGPGTRCHPLTVLDDHSRFNLCLRACLDERGTTVQRELMNVFRRYGMPYRFTTDNGPPWGTSRGESLSWLGTWIVRLGMRLSHSTPGHPQTQGKDERFHRTLKLELLAREDFVLCDDSQVGMDRWRHQYNHLRPHEALGMKTPLSRYTASVRSFPEVLPAIEYDSQDTVRRVQGKGEINLHGKEYVIGRGLRGMPVAMRATEEDGQWSVFFCHQELGTIDERRGTFTRKKRQDWEADGETLTPSETP